MTAKLRYRLIMAGCVVVASLAPAVAVFLAAGTVSGTPGLMTRLPAYEKFKCLICHTSSSPTAGSSGLNAFGVDFRSNGQVWDQTLAMLNSDGDRCLNGFELGDEDGDGTLDSSGPAVERSNPGDGSDCSIAMTFRTWGAIKEVFRSEMRNYFDDGQVGYRQLDDEDFSHFP